MTPLCQRMIEDLQLRGLSVRTQEMYVRAVRQLADHDHTSPDRLTEEALRDSFLSLKNDKHASRAASTIALCGITFFYEYTLKREWTTLTFVRPSQEHTLPVILSLSDVHTLLPCVRQPLCFVNGCSRGLRKKPRISNIWEDFSSGSLCSRTLPLSCGPQEKTPGIPHKAALWAVRCRVEPMVTHPAPPQTRTGAMHAYGSSSRASATRRRPRASWCPGWCARRLSPARARPWGAGASRPHGPRDAAPRRLPPAPLRGLHWALGPRYRAGFHGAWSPRRARGLGASPRPRQGLGAPGPPGRAWAQGDRWRSHVPAFPR